MDGCDALPDPEAQRSECRDELECARLQPETGNESNGHRQLDGSHDSVKARAFTIDTGATKCLRGCWAASRAARNVVTLFSS